MKTSLFSIINK